MKVLRWNKSDYAKPCWYQMGPWNVLNSVVGTEKRRAGRQEDRDIIKTEGGEKK